MENEVKVLTPEQWFDIIQNMRTFALNPKHVDRRFSGILEACRQNRLPDTEQLQYIRAMISEREKQEIAEVYLERGIEQGKIDVAKQMLARGFDVAVISEITGLPAEVISQL